MSLQKKKYTSMKTNKRVLMPPSRPVKEECVIQAGAEAWKSVWRQYMDSKTNTRGSQEHHQFSKQEIEGK